MFIYANLLQLELANPVNVADWLAWWTHYGCVSVCVFVRCVCALSVPVDAAS